MKYNVTTCLYIIFDTKEVLTNYEFTIKKFLELRKVEKILKVKFFFNLCSIFFTVTILFHNKILEFIRTHFLNMVFNFTPLSKNNIYINKIELNKTKTIPIVRYPV